MKISRIAVYATILAFSGAIAADEPIELSTAQMDQITAGSLKLPNGNVSQDNFDNPAPNVNGYIGLCNEATGEFCHPALTRRSATALCATAGHGPSVGGVNDGAWAATQASPVIDICGSPFPDC